MFRPLALPALAVLLWCVARAPNVPPTYGLPLDPRAEDARDPGPDPDVCPLGLGRREDDFPELDRIDHLVTSEAIEREWLESDFLHHHR